ncbi:hypothetical protein [Mesorhizobium sp. 1M-11]|uniref:antitoxin Xre/MbcA/ParS-like domain-containing protein n=1 Tax=Mesorhizobium sp. 1M-11 TaxID=1529006 RepID=UPI0006C73E5A|nr:hypothetical protein [Mesorhizobium sp. 1M-11]
MNELTSATSGAARSELERLAAAELERVLRNSAGAVGEEAVRPAAVVGGSIAAAIVNLAPRQRRVLGPALKDPSKLAAKIIKLLLVDAAQTLETAVSVPGFDSTASPTESDFGLSAQRNGLASVLIEEWAGQVAGSTHLEEALRIPRSTLHRWQRRGEVIALRTGGRKHVFPLAQFVDGRPVSGIREVLALIGHPRATWSWLVRATSEFDGEAPIALLVKDRAQDVIRAAEAFSARVDKPVQAG